MALLTSFKWLKCNTDDFRGAPLPLRYRPRGCCSLSEMFWKPQVVVVFHLVPPHLSGFLSYPLALALFSK